MADSGEKPQTEEFSVCKFFPKSLKDKNFRKRTVEEDDTESKPRVHSCAVRRKPLKPDDQLYFSTGQSKNSESGAPVFQFESLNEIQVDHDSRATATLETKTELSKDTWAIRKRVLKHAEEDLKYKTLNTGDVKLYKGIHGYTDYKAGFWRESKLLPAKRRERLMALPGLLLTFEQRRELIISQTYTGIHASFCLTVDEYLLHSHRRGLPHRH